MAQCVIGGCVVIQVMSYGMVLCASDATHENVEPVKVPEGVPLGEKITFEGFTGEAPSLQEPPLLLI